MYGVLRTCFDERTFNHCQAINRSLKFDPWRFVLFFFFFSYRTYLLQPTHYYYSCRIPDNCDWLDSIVRYLYGIRTDPSIKLAFINFTLFSLHFTPSLSLSLFSFFRFSSLSLLFIWWWWYKIKPICYVIK